METNVNYLGFIFKKNVYINIVGPRFWVWVCEYHSINMLNRNGKQEGRYTDILREIEIEILLFFKWKPSS